MATYELERSRVRTIQSAIQAALSMGGLIEKNMKKSAYAIPFYEAEFVCMCRWDTHLFHLKHIKLNIFFIYM